MAARLSAAQRAVLERLSAGDALSFRYGDARNGLRCWWEADRAHVPAVTVYALRARGLVRIVREPDAPWWRYAVVREAAPAAEPPAGPTDG